MAGNAEIDLPASPYRLLNALDEIGIKSTKEIVYQEILNYGSFGYLEPHFDEYTMLEELNTLAQKLAVFDRVDSIAFEGLVKMAEQKPEPFGVKELINFAHSTESCHVVSDVFDDEQLVFRHYLRWPYPMYKPSQFDSFNHEHTCLASKLTNIELSDICPLAKAGQPFEVARENTCEECKYFCRIHYEVDPEYGDKQVHFWMNEEIVTFF